MIFKQIQNLEDAQSIVVPFLKGKIDYELIAQLAGVTEEIFFDGNFKQLMSLPRRNGKQWIYLIGLGNEKDFSQASEAFRWLAHKRNKQWKNQIGVKLEHLSGDYQEACALGLGLSTYQIGSLKTEKKSTSSLLNEGFEVLIQTDSYSQSVLDNAVATADTMKSIMALVDAPGNVKVPRFLAQWAQDSAKTYGYSCTVLGEKELVEKGFDAHLAVGQGSRHESVLIQCEYNGQKGSETIALVGKGITFDTGGLSIKPSNNMHHMKSDMGGAAAVLGTIELAAKLKLPVNLVGIVGSAENAVDANSIKPGDVIGSYSGKSIEVIDTDAEGRLVLADALNYAVKTFNPDQIIDLATLTGSSLMTLGYSAGAMFTNNNEMKEGLEKAGYETHERVWQLPLFDDFKSDLHSDIADVRNYSGKPLAGAITAAKFLEVFTEDHKAWVHLDIAGVAFGDSPYSKMQAAKGYGPRLLLAYLKTQFE